MDQRIINLYDEYTHKPLSRTEFLKRLTLLAGSTAAAMAILPLIEVNQAHAAITPDEDLFTERITYPGINGDMQAYLAIAPNALSLLGGTPANEDEARTKFQELKAEDNLQNFIKAFDYLPTRKDSNGKYGCVGFCWGGGMRNVLAV